jgi:CHAT domain-containing protein
VVASAWPVSDEPGGIFRVFYSELQRAESPDPAGALRAAQIEAIRSAGWRARPNYWAAYFTVGNY